MTVSGLLLFAGVYLAAVASPGPGVALVVARSLGQGLSHLGWFIGGFLAGDFVLFTLAALGLSVLAQSFGAAFAVLRYAGAAYLLYLAWKIWSQPALVDAARTAPARETRAQAFLSSFLLTLGNPKTILFFVSIMPLAVDMKAMRPLVFAQLAAAIVVLLPLVLSAYALLAVAARRLFRSPRAVRRINRLTAAAMAGAAIAIATR